MVSDAIIEPAESLEDRSPLLPDRHPTGDLFVCDVFDAAFKGDTASMEHPIFSLSTKPDHRKRHYEHDGKFIEISPSADGLATVHDRDILIYCISQLMLASNRGEAIQQTVRLKAYDLLKATNRMTSGPGYEGLKAALKRLGGTRINTNITTADVEQWDEFGIIERSRIVRETRDGRMQEVEIKLSDWVFNAIRAREVLTLNRDYFRLRKPLERRLYEIARKHCGQSARWNIRLETLQKKTGSNSTQKEFRRLVQNIVQANAGHDHFPDYQIFLEEDLVTFRPKAGFSNRFLPNADDGGFDAQAIRLPSDIHEVVRREAKGYDLYMLETNWREMLTKKQSKPANPVGSFRAYVRWYVKEHGPAR
ncbi:replication initiator protein A (plasmid) [Roseibium porphyridii]|uniref:Replication initiator protein A n=1 Tax=Roseibium porphyridii TaxID=2866279 RepID=A0ABY8FAW2_9HYPH|nr:replication initiator protein A [Roseibium sp. KMA01]WFE92638.1 replication initiator protein A [Roseibium sp. KMA01]